MSGAAAAEAIMKISQANREGGWRGVRDMQRASLEVDLPPNDPLVLRPSLPPLHPPPLGTVGVVALAAPW